MGVAQKVAARLLPIMHARALADQIEAAQMIEHLDATSVLVFSGLPSQEWEDFFQKALRQHFEDVADATESDAEFAGPVIICLPKGASLSRLDEDAMRAAGWVRRGS